MKQGHSLFLIAALVVGTQAWSQDFNIDVGQPGSQPHPWYAAAGQRGVWNSVTGAHITPFTPGPTPQDDILVDIYGNPTSVGFHQFGGMDLVSANDPSVSGEDAELMNDYLATHSANLENCMYLNGLQNGTYEVLTYAWMPNSTFTRQLVRFDFHPDTYLVGGVWNGQHLEGVTFSRHIVEVTNGRIGFHSGIPSGGMINPGAAFNGAQIRLLTGVPTFGGWHVALLFGAVATAGGILRRRRMAIRYRH